MGFSYLVLFFKILFYVYGCLCIAHVPRAGRGQKRVYDPLELELEMVVDHCVG